MHSYQFPQRQHGAILVVSLLLLLVMTALALSSSNSTRLQERMAGNSRDLELAFQGSEAGLRQSEFDLQDAANKAGMRAIVPCTDATKKCVVDRPTAYIDYKRKDKDWWTKNARSYGDPAVKELDELVDDPLLRSELWVAVSDTLTDGARPNTKPGVAYYVNSTRTLGGTESAEVVLQSVVAVPYVE